MEEKYFCDACRHWIKVEDYDTDEGMCVKCLEKQLEDGEEPNDEGE
jgi:hypothetical protein